MHTGTMDKYYAHSGNSAGSWHLLRDHLDSVSKRASEFLQGCEPEEQEAGLSGLGHDVGKYGDRFQNRLHGKDSGLDHWSSGASWVLMKFHAVAAALAIEGHHIGLQRGDKASLIRLVPTNLSSNILPGLQLSDPDIKRLEERTISDGLMPHEPGSLVISLFNGWKHAVASMLDVRMVFSALVDADFLDTEAHFNNGERVTGLTLDAERALEALNHYMDNLRSSTHINNSTKNSKVGDVREMLWDAAGTAGSSADRLFTMTAPTGSGKTLAMLRFAMEHAKSHKRKRIVVVMPFLTIIEQTASIYRNVFKDFPANFVLEHHSLAGLGVETAKGDAEGEEARQRRLLSENWDAPIVITTNVQLLESLFANRPSACRKLHNLIDSVILFDEVQTLPQKLAVPTLAALAHLTEHYRSTVVFATATQPAFNTLSELVEEAGGIGWQPHEIAKTHKNMFTSTKRVEVRWSVSEKRSWDGVATEILDRLKGRNASVLAVVNLKRHANDLFRILSKAPNKPDGLFYLSTNLCAEHRQTVLQNVKSCLTKGIPCCLVSTQCVEAGVDIDFPVVFRAMAPLDSIAQAAGRCNREGTLNEKGRLGEVVIFEPDEKVKEERYLYPTYSYWQATSVTQSILKKYENNLDINDPDVFNEYYNALYKVNGYISHNKKPDTALTLAIAACDFPEVAKHYHLIDKSTIQVLVPWSGARDRFDYLRREADQYGITTNWIRRAQGLMVSVYQTANGHVPEWAIPAKLQHKHNILSDEWFVLKGKYYDDVLGLTPPSGEQVFIA